MFPLSTMYSDSEVFFEVQQAAQSLFCLYLEVCAGCAFMTLIIVLFDLCENLPSLFLNTSKIENIGGLDLMDPDIEYCP